MRMINADEMDFSKIHLNKSQMKAVLDFMDAQPTAYDVDAVVEQIQKEIDSNPSMMEIAEFWKNGMKRAAEIVKAGGQHE